MINEAHQTVYEWDDGLPGIVIPHDPDKTCELHYRTAMTFADLVQLAEMVEAAINLRKQFADLLQVDVNATTDGWVADLLTDAGVYDDEDDDDEIGLEDVDSLT